MKKRIPVVRLMQYGKITYGKFSRMEATSATVNDARVYRFYFSFTADNGNTYEATGETHLTHKLEDEPEEMIIYDPRHPEKAYVIDSFAKNVKKFLLKNS